MKLQAEEFFDEKEDMLNKSKEVLDMTHRILKHYKEREKNKFQRRAIEDMMDEEASNLFNVGDLLFYYVGAAYV